jgi:tetratricopeptide (TPR) repeat protein
MKPIGIIARFGLLTLAFAAPALADDRTDCADIGRADVAIAACTRVIQAGAQGEARASALYNRAGAWRAAGDSARAIADYSAAIAMAPAFAAAYNNRGLEFLAAGEVDRAIADFDQAVRVRPDFAEAWNNRALANRRKSRYPEALEDFGKAIAANPAFVDAWFGRGVVRADIGDYDAAIADYDKAIELDPRFAAALNNRADAHLKKGAYGQAIADLNRTIDLNPALPEAWYTRGEVLRATGRYRDARDDILKAMEIDQGGVNHAYGNALIADIDRALAAEEAVTPVGEEHRVALVIGNGNYDSVGRLTNPPNDAETIARVLRRSGFDEVTVVHDADRAGFVAALQTFAEAADRADWAVLYYAGHGMEIGGENYMIPTDARLASDRDVPTESILLDSLIAAVSGAERMRLVVVDACRDNPFAARMKVTSTALAVGRGLAVVEPSKATMVVFAAKAGTVAADGDTINSPFATALATRLSEPGLEVNKVFRFVSRDVLRVTNNAQEPFVHGSLPPEDFFFVPPAN